MSDKPGKEPLQPNSETEDNVDKISRRDLLQLSGLTAAALAAPIILTNTNQADATPAPKDTYTSNVLVVGSGFAGVFAAVEAAQAGAKVVLVDKGTVGWSGMSPWASDSRPFDPEIYARQEWHDNLRFSTEWVYNRRWIELFMDQSLDIFMTLRGWGTHDCKPFERSNVFRRVLEENNVEIVERVMLTRLVKNDEGRVAGAVGFTFDDSETESKAVEFNAGAVILATGAGSYKSPGFPIWGLSFDGDAMAYDAGACITGKEYNDTHGTLSTAPAASYDNWSWAQDVTGSYVMAGPPGLNGGLNLAGALNVFQNGAVSSGVADGRGGPGTGPPAGSGNAKALREKYEGRGFLTLPNLTIDWGEPPDATPEGGSDAPRGHRVGGATAGMGVHKGEGVFSSNDDYSCMADGVEGLFAAGDALGSMMCGAAYPGRGFASYGSAIQGKRAGQFAAEYVKQNPSKPASQAAFNAKIAETWSPRKVARGYTPNWAIRALQNTMTPIQTLYIKSERRLDGALASVEYLREHVVPNLIARDGHELRLAHEAANMLLNAEMKLRAGLYRTESRGTHFREEFPARNDKDWFCWVLLHDEQGKMTPSKYQLPREWAPPQTMSYRESYPLEFPGENEFLRANPGWGVWS